MGTHFKYIYLAWANKSVCITALAETFSILIAFLFAFPEKSPDCRVSEMEYTMKLLNQEVVPVVPGGSLSTREKQSTHETAFDNDENFGWAVHDERPETFPSWMDNKWNERTQTWVYHITEVSQVQQVLCLIFEF